MSQSDAGWITTRIPEDRRHPRLSAKRLKVLAPQFELRRYDYTIWVDASHLIKSASFATEALEGLGPDGFSLHSHTGRDCIYDEAEASLRVAHKYDGQPIIAQAEHYRARGFPEHAGLWACGSMARARSDRLDAAMRDWWDEICAWTVQDQISLPPVLARHGLEAKAWPHRQYESPWFDILSHADGT